MSDFREAVEDVVRRIPYGAVISYGDIAAICGRPRAARQVGQLAHYGDPSLPWHRVIRKSGGLAGGYPGGMQAQQVALEAEGVVIKNFIVQRMEHVVWKL